MKQAQSQKILFISLLVLLSIFVNVTFIIRPLKIKKWLHKIYKPPLKTTLQRLEWPFIENDITVRILKIKHKDKIYLEFLNKQSDDSYVVINSVELKGQHEGYFKYWEDEMVSLMVLDVDGDGNLDVIAPTFNEFFYPQINLVTYNQASHRFELQTKAIYPKVITR